MHPHITYYKSFYYSPSKRAKLKWVPHFSHVEFLPLKME
jgi:hypothetical protein